jgi:hypothetical protein
MNHTKHIKVIVLVDDKEDATAECDVPAQLAEYVVGAILTQVADPDLDGAKEAAEVDDTNPLPKVVRALNGNTLLRGETWCVKSILYDYPGCISYPGCINVNFVDGRSLAFSFGGDCTDFGWALYVDVAGSAVIDVGAPKSLYAEADAIDCASSIETIANYVRKVIVYVGDIS